MENIKDLMEAKEHLKNWLKWYLSALIDTKFDENFKKMIALGYWYQAELLEKKPVTRKEKQQTQNEAWEMQEVEVEVFSFVEEKVPNPITHSDFIACKWFDILFDDSVLSLENYQKNIALPQAIAEAIKKVEI